MDLLEDCAPADGPNSTELSRTASTIVSAFLHRGVRAVRVRWRQTKWGQNEVYKALWDAAVGLPVAVSRRGEEIIITRKERL